MEDAGETPLPAAGSRDPLTLLREKANEVRRAFDLLPSNLQMDGLDILQGIVTDTVRRITMGRISAVQFVPVADKNKAISLEQDHSKDITSTTDEVKLENTVNTNADSDTNGQSEELRTDPASKGRSSWTPSSEGAATMEEGDCEESMSEGPKGDCEKKLKEEGMPSQVSTAEPVNGIQDGEDSDGSMPPLTAKRGFPDSGSVRGCRWAAKVAVTKIHYWGHAENEADLHDHDKPSSSTSCRKEQVDRKPRIADQQLGSSFQASPGLASASMIGEGQPALSGSLDVSHVKEEPISDAENDTAYSLQATPPRTPCRSSGEDGRCLCRYCAYSCEDQAHLDLHLKHVHSGIRFYECEFCRKKFSAASSLKRHKMTHTGEKEHACPVCGKQFYQLSQLRVHSVVHTGERLYKCPRCSKCYTNSANLRRHERIHTGERPYACGECEARYRDLASLKLHKLKHTGDKPYACHVCGKQFKTSSDYRIHERIHTGERKFQCTDCGKLFVQGWHLKQHQKVHNNDRPWRCDQCGKRLRTKASLQFHTKSHLGIKDFTCATCHKSFSTKKYLQNHQVVHTAAKPFSCSFCGARFNQYANKKRHERLHTQGTYRATGRGHKKVSTSTPDTQTADTPGVEGDLHTQGSYKETGVDQKVVSTSPHLHTQAAASQPVPTTPTSPVVRLWRLDPQLLPPPGRTMVKLEGHIAHLAAQTSGKASSLSTTSPHARLPFRFPRIVLRLPTNKGRSQKKAVKGKNPRPKKVQKKGKVQQRPPPLSEGLPTASSADSMPDSKDERPYPVQLVAAAVIRRRSADKMAAPSASCPPAETATVTSPLRPSDAGGDQVVCVKEEVYEEVGKNNSAVEVLGTVAPLCGEGGECERAGTSKEMETVKSDMDVMKAAYSS